MLLHHTTNINERKGKYIRSQIYLKHHKTIILWLYRNKTKQSQLLRVKEPNMAASSLSNIIVAKSVYQQPTLQYTPDLQNLQRQHMLQKEAYCLRKSPNQHPLIEVVNPLLLQAQSLDPRCNCKTSRYESSIQTFCR